MRALVYDTFSNNHLLFWIFHMPNTYILTFVEVRARARGASRVCALRCHARPTAAHTGNRSTLTPTPPHTHLTFPAAHDYAYRE